MNSYTATYSFEFWSGTLLDTTVIAQNVYQAERLAREKLWKKYHDFMLKNRINDIDIRSVKLIGEDIPQSILAGGVGMTVRIIHQLKTNGFNDLSGAVDALMEIITEMEGKKSTKRKSSNATRQSTTREALRE